MDEGAADRARQEVRVDSKRLPVTIGVLGGGTSGYFAALALKRRFPRLDVTVVESSKIPIIGVGEATTTLMPPFLHHELGLDPVELFARVRPTFKLSIRFEWGAPGAYDFDYPFGDADPVSAMAHDGSLDTQSVISLLCRSDRVPMTRGADGAPVSHLSRLRWAYHLDNAPFVAYLAEVARARGIRHVDATITGARRRAAGDGIDAVTTDDGRALHFDFFVDATGFRSLVMGGALGSPFESFASSLFCDRAVVASVPQADGRIRAYTTAETMDAGWCWRIPVDGEDHRGYVFASSFIDEAIAIEEMRTKNPTMGEPWVVKFRSGRHRDFWRGNVAAIGNAYGFVEPLESTALHMVIVELGYILHHLAEGYAAFHDGRLSPTLVTVNQRIAEHWDYLRWFLGVHYRYNGKLDTPFWRAARADVDVSGLAEALARFESDGPWDADAGKRYGAGDPTFGWSGLMVMLLGQHAPTRAETRPLVPRSTWDARVASDRRLVESALPQRDALAVLAQRPDMLREYTDSMRSWLRHHGEWAYIPPG